MKQEVSLARYTIEQMDEEMKQQLIALENTVWSECDTTEYPEDVSTFVAAFLLWKEEKIIAHAALHSMKVFHKGNLYQVFGIKEVLVSPSFQGNGYGRRVVQAVFSYLEQQGSGLSIFTCHPNLIHFYEQAGWRYMPFLCLVGGTKQHLFRSDEQGVCVMLGLHGDDVRKRQADFVNGDIILELGEHKLW